MKIFLGLDDTCGYYTRLKSGFKSLGVSCSLVNAFPNPNYNFDHNLGFVEKMVARIGNKTAIYKRNSLRRYGWIGIKCVALLILFLWTLPRYDVYIFSGGTTFIGSYDLWLLKLLNKRVIVVYHGSDSRAPYLNPVIVGYNGDFDAKVCVSETKVIRNKLKKIERYADLIINNPNASHLHEGKIINWFCIGSPFFLPPLSGKIDIKTSADDSCVIVHAPSRAGPKGTRQIEEAINALKEKGHKIKYVKLVGKPNSEVLENLSKCDFVVDELFSDVIMAGFAGEAASFAKPAVVGMYEYEKIKNSIPVEMVPPILSCSPDDVESAMEKLIIDKEFRISLGKKAREFIENQWSPEAVAKRFLLLAKNEIPENWWFDTQKINYLHGWGVTEKRTKDLLLTIIKSYGTPALQLKHNPNLEKAFIHFAREK
jgi:glycosyltransferase involved in cell wall biosynthesis